MDPFSLFSLSSKVPSSEKPILTPKSKPTLPTHLYPLPYPDPQVQAHPSNPPLPLPHSSLLYHFSRNSSSMRARSWSPSTAVFQQTVLSPSWLVFSFAYSMLKFPSSSYNSSRKYVISPQAISFSFFHFQTLSKGPLHGRQLLPHLPFPPQQLTMGLWLQPLADKILRSRLSPPATRVTHYGTPGLPSPQTRV